MNEPIRLAKYFTDCGVLSRRAAEEEIKKGRVKVNGVPAELGQKITPGVDVVEYAGKRITPPRQSGKVYLMLNKPRGFVTTMQDEKGRPTVADLTSGVGARVYPVGRLDMDSEGLLLLTDDGEFANQLTHPRHEIPKIYHVTLSKVLTKEEIAALRAPMELDGYRLQPVTVKKLAPDTVQMNLYEGRNRQIRRMCEAAGLKVIRLQRIAIGDLGLGDLPLGKWRELTANEVQYLTTGKKKG
jgi:23S rRNA pseudouridine2605 synthase